MAFIERKRYIFLKCSNQLDLLKMTPSFLAIVTLYVVKQLRTEGKWKLGSHMFALNCIVDILVEIFGQEIKC